MKKLLSFVLALAIMLSCSAALADIGSSTLVPRDAASTVRDIQIQGRALGDGGFQAQPRRSKIVLTG